jgi:hypothetical protein
MDRFETIAAQSLGVLAAEYLPDRYTLSIKLRRGSGQVELRDEHGPNLLPDSDRWSVAECVLYAVNYARAREGLQPVALDGSPCFEVA